MFFFIENSLTDKYISKKLNNFLLPKGTVQHSCKIKTETEGDKEISAKYSYEKAQQKTGK